MFDNNSQRLVSIIIPTYNRKKTIKDCLSSVLTQTYSNIEVIIVDDASNDGTQELLENISDNRLYYYRLNKNSGACFARNYGASMAHGYYIAFQDSDDI